MKSRYSVTLNNVPLSALDDCIYVSDISYTPASPKHETTRYAARQGVYAGEPYIESSRVTVSFMIRHYTTHERQQTAQQVMRWCAAGGWLQTSDRPHQRIYVRCTRFPAVESALRWTDALTVEFTAFAYPFWQDSMPATVSLSSGDTQSVFMPGVWPADIEATVTAREAITTFTITCGATSMTFSGLSVSEGGTVTISYTDDRHLLEAKADGVSVLDKRTSESSDDLVLAPGDGTVSFTADARAGCRLLIRGVWL